jgi:hypothetical protein
MICNSGYHLCGSTCALNTSVSTCGTSCSACPIPANGTATCDGTSCGSTCNTGYHSCSGVCSSNTSVNSCGASCTPCPTASNGTTSCLSNGSCNLACNAGYLQCQGGTLSCAIATWSFDDGTADGFTLDSMPGNAASGIGVGAAQAFDGTQSLSIPSVFNSSRTAFIVNFSPCGSASIPAAVLGQTLTFEIYPEGPAVPSALQPTVTLLTQSSNPTITIPALTNNTWNKVTVPLTDPGNAALEGWNIEFYMPLGSTWSGTVYFDAFKIQ